MRRISQLVIHHSASPLGTTLEDIRSWHLERGFRDIGYHFVIEQNGALRVGRPLHEPGAHARGFNQTSIGVCAVGDNTRTEERWTPSQWAALDRLIAAVRLLWPDVEVVGHRDLLDTLCPGVDVREIIDAAA